MTNKEIYLSWSIGYGKSRADQEGFEEVAACHPSAFAFEILAKFKSTKNQQTIAKQDFTAVFM